jgi:hypothetical protein
MPLSVKRVKQIQSLLTYGGAFGHSVCIMDRREFVTSFAALGATAALPTIASAQTDGRASGSSDTPPTVAETLRLATLRKETTRQLTTFNLGRKSKTVAVPRGKRVTIGEVKGRGYIVQFWLTFPGWFWQHWNAKAPINQSILKTLILRIYWDQTSVKPAFWSGDDRNLKPRFFAQMKPQPSA